MDPHVQNLIAGICADYTRMEEVLNGAVAKFVSQANALKFDSIPNAQRSIINPLFETEAKRNQRWLEECKATRALCADRWIPYCEADMVKKQDEEDEEGFEAAKNVKDIARLIYLIIGRWCRVAGGEAPNHFAIQVDSGLSITLIQVLALVPHWCQKHIKIHDPERYNGGSLSWLDENIMYAIIHMESLVYAPKPDSSPVTKAKKGGKKRKASELTDDNANASSSSAPAPIVSVPIPNCTVLGSTVFSRKLSTLVTHTLDEHFKTIASASYLELLTLQSRINGDTPAAWNPGNVFTIPRTTTKLMFFWNYTEVHWVYVSVSINAKQWVYSVYNSADGDNAEHTREQASYVSFENMMLLLEALIRKASGFEESKERSVVVPQHSLQQENRFDCGVMAVGNALKEMFGADIRSTDFTLGRSLRLAMLTTVWEWLENKFPSS